MAKKEPPQQPPSDQSQPPSTSSSLARPPSDEEAAALAALAEAGFDADSPDGLSEIRASDLRMPLKLFNLKQGEAVNGKVTQDTFFDTIERTVSSELTLVLLELHKSNAYKLYNNKDKRTDTICTSYDQVTGTMTGSGIVRPCKGCPDAAWKTEPDGKRVQPCSEVWNVAAFDCDSQKVVLIRFKRTSLGVIRNYLQAHHIGRRPLPGGKRGNIPLFAYKVRMTIAMDKTNNFALPAIERGVMLSVPDLKMMVESAAAVRENFAARLDASEADDGGGEGSAPASGGDTSFDVDAMAGTTGERGSSAFVDP